MTNTKLPFWKWLKELQKIAFKSKMCFWDETRLMKRKEIDDHFCRSNFLDHYWDNLTPQEAFDEEISEWEPIYPEDDF